MSGNTFGSTTKSLGIGQNIWHEIKGCYPVGGMVSNLADFSDYEVIPSGSMCVYDQAAKTVKIVKATDLKTTENEGGTVEPNTINGLLRHDIYNHKDVEKATASVVFAGEIYIDRCKEAIPDEVLANLPMIVPIREKRS